MIIRMNVRKTTIWKSFPLITPGCMKFSKQLEGDVREMLNYALECKYYVQNSRKTLWIQAKFDVWYCLGSSYSTVAIII